MYKGVFGDGISADGFNIYESVNAVFGGYNATTPAPNGFDYANAIQIIGKNTALAVNPMNSATMTSGDEPTIKIYYGVYRGNKSGSYYDSIYNNYWDTHRATVYVYNASGNTSSERTGRVKYFYVHITDENNAVNDINWQGGANQEWNGSW